MICNLCRYLQDQELECRRMHISANRAGEWEMVAEILLLIRQTHVKKCTRCQAAEPAQGYESSLDSSTPSEGGY